MSSPELYGEKRPKFIFRRSTVVHIRRHHATSSRPVPQNTNYTNMPFFFSRDKGRFLGLSIPRIASQPNRTVSDVLSSQPLSPSTSSPSTLSSSSPYASSPSTSSSNNSPYSPSPAQSFHHIHDASSPSTSSPSSSPYWPSHAQSFPTSTTQYMNIVVPLTGVGTTHQCNQSRIASCARQITNHHRLMRFSVMMIRRHRPSQLVSGPWFLFRHFLPHRFGRQPCASPLPPGLRGMKSLLLRLWCRSMRPRFTGRRLPVYGFSLLRERGFHSPQPAGNWSCKVMHFPASKL
ncbi:hypothetical protein DFH08DRAFT_881310 [Mycena albidolilacea]|uniref:Uncharacterized protein n=1 Tax=Mycena albidolilacea TaxID=1033008 RepID=A0AAD6ZPK1_9AGAR|nr:hypothetical protein DFH08DRAFT_881310 [Mycena albidolilacea]